MSLLLLFKNDFQDIIAAFNCNVATKFLPSGAKFKKRDYTGGSIAIVPAITVCNQGLESLFDVDELTNYNKVTD